MPAFHNVECYAFWIRDLIGKKNILFATDTRDIPYVADRKFDCMMLECNYSQKYIDSLENFDPNEIKGYHNHCSLEALSQWLNSRHNNTDNLVLIHMSHRGTITPEMATNALHGYAKNVFVAKGGLLLDI